MSFDFKTKFCILHKAFALLMPTQVNMIIFPLSLHNFCYTQHYFTLLVAPCTRALRIHTKIYANYSTMNN